MNTYDLRTDASATESSRSLLLAGIAGAVIIALGGLTTQVMQLTSDVNDDLWRWPWTAGAFPVVQVLWASAHALIIAGLLGLGRSRALLVAVAGSALLLTGELTSIGVAGSTDDPVAVQIFYSLGALLAGIGLVTAGRRTRLAGAWALVGVVLALTPIGYTAIGIWGLLLLITFLKGSADHRALSGSPVA